MNELGHYALILGWLLTCYALVSSVIAGKKESFRWFLSARAATIAASCSFITSVFSLGVLFAQNDYTNQYVWQFSNRDMEWYYKVSAIWGGMDGSMLLWLGILSVSGMILAIGSLHRSRRIMPWVIFSFNTTTIFFSSVVLYLSNPFRYIKAPFIPPDGNGLNPLLQNPYMAVHPPTLYAGFTIFAVPYAFCLGALLANDLSNEWLRLTRRWTLVAWGFLTAGIVMGGHWAYQELGWGGFWAWDPVENASFLPWLTGTAFLHSVMVQERKNMMKFWNVWLIVGTYALTVFGTYLTRSGIVQSVHAFASSGFAISLLFLIYLGLIVGSAALLTYRRRNELRSEREIESFLSRETAFLVNNLIFLGICFAVLWGVMFPVFSEAVTGHKQTVGIPFFNAVTVPLFLLMLLAMGVGPLIAWRKASLESIKKTFALPFITGCVVSGIVVWVGITQFYPVVTYGLCWFVVMTILGEVHRGYRAQGAATQLVKRHHVRYGGYLVHFGVVVMTIAITASMAHKFEKEFSLAQGESIQIGRFTLTLDLLRDASTANYQAVAADVVLTQTNNGSALKTLAPELRRYTRNDESTTEVALNSSLREDVYLILAGLDNEGTRGAFKVFINPLQVWLWLGTLIVLVGTVIVIIPNKQTKSREA